MTQVEFHFQSDSDPRHRDLKYVEGDEMKEYVANRNQCCPLFSLTSAEFWFGNGWGNESQLYMYSQLAVQQNSIQRQTSLSW